MDGGPIKSVVIHAVYLINCATKDKEMRKKSIASLTHALQMGDAIGADGVVVHPGSTVGEPHPEAIERAGVAFVEALKGSDSCPLLLGGHGWQWQHAGPRLHGAARPDRGGGSRQADRHLPRLVPHARVRLRHLDADKLGEVIDESVELVGIDMVKCLHVNDSKVPLGRTSIATPPPGDGQLGDRGCAAFLSEPRFEGLPALFEGPGVEGKAPGLADVDKMKALRKKGLAARKRRERR